jgi:hypothetical protein
MFENMVENYKLIKPENFKISEYTGDENKNWVCALFLPELALELKKSSVCVPLKRIKDDCDTGLPILSGYSSTTYGTMTHRGYSLNSNDANVNDNYESFPYFQGLQMLYKEIVRQRPDTIVDLIRYNAKKYIESDVGYVEYSVGKWDFISEYIRGAKAVKDTMTVRFLFVIGNGNDFSKLDKFRKNFSMLSKRERRCIVGVDVVGDETKRSIENYAHFTNGFIQFLKQNCLGVRIHLGEGVRIKSKEDNQNAALIFAGLLTIYKLKCNGVKVRIGHGLGVYDFLHCIRYDERKTKDPFEIFEFKDFKYEFPIVYWKKDFNHLEFEVHSWKEFIITLTEEVTIEVCPISNMLLLNQTASDSWENEIRDKCPLKDMVMFGCNICLGTDDPALFALQSAQTNLLNSLQTHGGDGRQVLELKKHKNRPVALNELVVQKFFGIVSLDAFHESSRTSKFCNCSQDVYCTDCAIRSSHQAERF